MPTIFYEIFNRKIKLNEENLKKFRKELKILLKELKKSIEYKPFKESELNNPNNTLYIGFLNSDPSKENQNNVFTMQDSANEFNFRNTELYWLCRKNFSDSGIDGKKLEKALGMQTTIRNSTTIRKMVDKFCK